MMTWPKSVYFFSVVIVFFFYVTSCSSDDSVSVGGVEFIDPSRQYLRMDVECVGMLPSSGFYNELSIFKSVVQYGDTVRCTFDGSAPVPETKKFDASYDVKKSTVVRCAEFVSDTITCKSEGTFFIQETVRMPVVSISVDPNQMFDPDTGYYSKGVDSCTYPCKEANYWQDLELPVHVEYFEEGSSSGEPEWKIEAGLSIIGNGSRNNAKKSLAIKMRSEYQDGRLKYPIFKTRPEKRKFKGFNLRNNGNRYGADYITDAALSSLLEGSGVDYQRSRQVVVFINGDYYGIYDLRERLNEHFVETNYGIDSKKVNFVKHWRTSVTASGGSTESYYAMLDFIHRNDLTKEDAYLQVSSMMDVGNYADYMAAEIYYHNGDWPNNNVSAWNTDDQPFKFVVYDLDHGFGWDRPAEGFDAENHNMFSWIKQGGQPGCNGKRCFAEIYIKLIENPDFKRLFINRSSVMLDYYLTYDRLEKTIDDMTATIPESEMKRDMKKYPRTNHYFDKTGATLKAYGINRSDVVREEYRKEFGLGKDISVTIASQGKGAVLLDGMVLPEKEYTGRFFKGNAMLLSAAPVKGCSFAGWSDGKMDNPRLVSPKDGAEYIALFK